MPAIPRKDVKRSKYVVDGLVSCPGTNSYCWSDYPVCSPPSLYEMIDGCCPRSYPNFAGDWCYTLGAEHEPYNSDGIDYGIEKWLSCPQQDYFCSDVGQVCSPPSMAEEYQGCCSTSVPNHVWGFCCGNDDTPPFCFLKYPFLSK